MVLHGGKTLKTTIKKNLPKSQKFARNVSVSQVRYNQTIFFAVHRNLTYDSESYDLMELYFETSHSESDRTPAIELFCENSQRVFAGKLHRGC